MNLQEKLEKDRQFREGFLNKRMNNRAKRDDSQKSTSELVKGYYNALPQARGGHHPSESYVRKSSASPNFSQQDHVRDSRTKSIEERPQPEPSSQEIIENSEPYASGANPPVAYSKTAQLRQKQEGLRSLGSIKEEDESLQYQSRQQPRELDDIILGRNTKSRQSRDQRGSPSIGSLSGGGSQFSQSRYWKKDSSTVEQNYPLAISDYPEMASVAQQPEIRKEAVATSQSKKQLRRPSPLAVSREPSKEQQISLKNQAGKQDLADLQQSFYDLYSANPNECRRLFYQIETNKEFILCFGLNKDGELGVPDSKVKEPKALSCNEKFDSAICISSGSHHTALVTKAGDLFICGSALHGKLGLPRHQISSLSKFTRVPALADKKIIQAACGDYHTMALTEQGDVYAWGGSLHKKSQGGSEPSLVHALKDMQARIIQIGCGDFHSIALDQNGRVFTWGGGGASYNKGQCGHGHTKDAEYPTQIEALSGERIVRICAGGFHNLAVSDQGKLFSWGNGVYGQCGQGEFLDVLSPQEIKIPDLQEKSTRAFNGGYSQTTITKRSSVKAIAAGGHHSLVLMSNGLLYSFGFGQHGQLGHRSNGNINAPRLVRDLETKPVLKIAAGWNHTLALTERGDLYACGYGNYGQLGLIQDFEIKAQFQHVFTLGPRNIFKVFAGGNHSWVVLDDIIPVRDKYRAPSPIKDRPVTRSTSPASRTRLKQQPPAERRNDFHIDITYSPDSSMIHRFINFEMTHENHEAVSVALQKYISQVESDDQGAFMYHQTQEQYTERMTTGVVQATREFQKKPDGRPAHEDSIKQITLVMVMDPESLHPNSSLRKEILLSFQKSLNQNRSRVFTESVYRTLSRVEIEQGGRALEQQLARWISQFLLIMSAHIEGTPRFSEIRPASFFRN